MEKDIDDFFQHIYEATRVETPEFKIHAWQDKVIKAFLNPTDPESAEVLAQEAVYQGQRATLMETYEKVVGTVLAMPEHLQPATLVAISPQVPPTLDLLGLSDTVKTSVMSELNDILLNLDVEPEHIAQVSTILSQQTEGDS